MHHEPGVDHHHEGQPAAQRAQPTFLQRPGAGRNLPLRCTGYGSLTHLHGCGETIILECRFIVCCYKVSHKLCTKVGGAKMSVFQEKGDSGDHITIIIKEL